MAKSEFIRPFAGMDIPFAYPATSDMARKVVDTAMAGATLPIAATYAGCPVIWECFVADCGVHRSDGEPVLRGTFASTGPPRPLREDGNDGNSE